VHATRTPGPPPPSLRDALPICAAAVRVAARCAAIASSAVAIRSRVSAGAGPPGRFAATFAGFCTAALGRLASALSTVLAEAGDRSEEHTSELQSRENLVCRLLP